MGAGEVTWLERGFEEPDLDGAWYVIAATDDPDANEHVSHAAERRIFCVRADDATRATAWTPAVGRHAGVTVAVLGNREPRRSAAVRDEILEGLREGTIVARHQRDRKAGVVLVGGGPGDPRPDVGRRPQGADGGRRRRRGPAGAAGAARRAAGRRRAGRRGQAAAGTSAQQEEINRIIVERALAGKLVVRFKGGDNFVFGRGYEEVLACREAGVPVTVIPGLTSPWPCPPWPASRSPTGVAHEFTVVSGHLPPGDPESLVNWEAVGGMVGTVVLMMAVNAPAIAKALIAGGRAEPPRSRSSATARCRGSGRCWPRWGRSGPSSRPRRSSRPRSSWSAAWSRWRIRRRSARRPGRPRPDGHPARDL